ncbi:MAG: transposase [Puniceicoccales bacterium]|nr:transposase [Puniceicoccales bacterium]
MEDALYWKPAQGNFIIDSTPIKLCLQVRANVFRIMREAMGKAVSSTKIVFGFKVHIVTDATGKKAINFCYSNGSAHDICFLEKLLANCTGTAIGDSGYVSSDRAKRLMEHDLRFIAKKRKNMKVQNTAEEKQQLRIRSRIENFNQKFKKFVGEDFSRFRVWTSAKAVIAIGILAINLGF